MTASGDPQRTSQLKQRALEAIRDRRERVVALAEEVWRTPELGFKETRTAARVAEFLDSLGLPVRTGLALTGVKAVLGGSAGPTSRPRVAVLGELDAVTCPGHPAADPQTGAAHACGHHAQLAVLAGAAIGLTAAGVREGLGGSVAFMAVPAEEYVEIEYRLELRRAGKIEFLGGKPELLRLGEFDDIDLAILVHAGGSAGSKISVGGTSNGFIGKFVRYIGREAHAGAAPWAGANALNSALLGISGINALRETFNDEDAVRVHPIITKGGDLVNIVPADVRLETYVRGRSARVVSEVSARVNRALEAGALALGTSVEIDDLPGFLPMLPDPGLARLFRRNLIDLAGPENVAESGHMSGSTDMGDLSHVMPALHPYGGGVTGRPHGPDFAVVDPELAYLRPAEAVALTVIDLLADEAAEARRILDDHRPAMSHAEYLDFARSLFRRTVYPKEADAQ